MKRSQFECVLVGLCAGIDQKEAVVFVARNLSQTFGKILLQAVYYGIGIKTYAGSLFADTLHIMRVRMPDGNHGVPSVQVQVFSSLLVVNVAILAADNFQVV